MWQEMDITPLSVTCENKTAWAGRPILRACSSSAKQGGEEARLRKTSIFLENTNAKPGKSTGSIDYHHSGAYTTDLQDIILDQDPNYPGELP
jgi:hypothetical protein